MSDPREAKLPKWAQDELRSLRLVLESTTDKLDALRSGTEPNSMWLEAWESREKKFYLPKYGGRLMFQSGKHCIHIHEGTNGRDKSWLELNGGTTLIVQPQSSNLLLVRCWDE